MITSYPVSLIRLADIAHRTACAAALPTVPTSRCSSGWRTSPYAWFNPQTMADRIRLNDMVFYGYHGVLAEERALGQRFVVGVEIRTDLRGAGLSDDLSRTVNYAEVYLAVQEIVSGPPCHLIEAVAERIASRLLMDHPLAQSVAVRVRKPDVPIPGAVLGGAEVWIERERGTPPHQ